MNNVRIGYVRETKDTCDIVRRIILRIYRFFNVIKVEKKEEKTIYYLPVFKNSKFSKYRIKKITNKLNNLLEKEGINTVVISKYLEMLNDFKIYLYCKNINILDGRHLFKCLIYDCIKYVFNIRKKKMEFR